MSNVRTIGGHLSTAEKGTARYRENLGNVLAYVLKGTSEEARAALRLVRYGEGGKIIDKRCGRTQNLE